ncbi:MAG: DUF3185 family protein [Gammaproteobacteria bacterium]|nr:DUF3185 family protein [Gammaproteobacteria bacterium]
MANGTNTLLKLVGLALLVLGVGLAYWGFQLSDSIQSELTEVVTGAETDKVMQFYIAGAISVVAGLFLTLKR